MHEAHASTRLSSQNAVVSFVAFPKFPPKRCRFPFHRFLRYPLPRIIPPVRVAEIPIRR